MQRIEIDGVPAFTAPGPERITAVLSFGVGLRDEAFAAVGVTHLIEHLVMGTLPKSHLRCNAMVTVDVTAFYATGRPEAVRSPRPLGDQLIRQGKLSHSPDRLRPGLSHS